MAAAEGYDLCGAWDSWRRKTLCGAPFFAWAGVFAALAALNAPSLLPRTFPHFFALIVENGVNPSTPYRKNRVNPALIGLGGAARGFESSRG